VSAVAGRVRAINLTAAGVATRVRSKGLSTGANGAPAEPPARRGIRYRE
jgi:hypothetical protein